MRQDPAWAGELRPLAKPKGTTSIACLLFVALLGTAFWSAALWVYQFWFN